MGLLVITTALMYDMPRGQRSKMIMRCCVYVCAARAMGVMAKSSYHAGRHDDIAVVIQR